MQQRDYFNRQLLNIHKQNSIHNKYISNIQSPKTYVSYINADAQHSSKMDCLNARMKAKQAMQTKTKQNSINRLENPFYSARFA